MGKRGSAEDTIRTIRRRTRRQYSAEEKIRIVLDGVRLQPHLIPLMCSILYHTPNDLLTGSSMMMR